MVMVVQNSAGELEEYTTGKSPDRPELKSTPKDEPKTEPKVEAKTEAKTEEKDEEQDYAKRLGLSAEQHKSMTEIIKREVGKKHRQIKEAEEFAAAQYNERRLAEERAESATRELEEARKASQPAKKDIERPDRTKFTDPDLYEDALLAWNRAEAIKEYEEKQAKEREETRKAQILEAASQRIKKAIELVPDFAEVTGAADDFIPSHIAAYMQESEMFAELGYHFAQHPEDLNKLASMPARTYSDLVRVGVALDKIESTLSPFAAPAKATNGATPKTTNGSQPNPDTDSVPSQPRAAAPVIQPLSAGSGTQVEKPAARMNYEETRAAWERTHRKDLSRRSRH